MRRKKMPSIAVEVLVEHALFGAGFTANMLANNPANSPETRRAYQWAEEEFVRIANKRVDERDLIG